MMLSPSAARMSHHVKDSLFGRNTGKAVLTSGRTLMTRSSKSSSLLLTESSGALWKPRRWSSLTVMTRRWKSTAAAFVDDSDSDPEDTIFDSRSKGFSDAAKMRALRSAGEVASSHEEAWMINLGRGEDNAWLTGPREDSWWTGVHPRDCPGTLCSTCLYWMVCCWSFVFQSVNERNNRIMVFLSYTSNCSLLACPS